MLSDSTRIGRSCLGVALSTTAAVAWSISCLATPIMDWDASNYSGTFSDGWTDSVGGVVGNQGGGNGPVKSSGLISGINVDYLTFTDDSFDINVTDHPLVGLSEFSISLLFRLPTTYNAINRDENTFWEHNGVVGKEIGGPAIGDWNLGFTDTAGDGGAQIVGGTGLGTADIGTSDPNNVNDGEWHVATFVVDDLGGGIFNQIVYVDGLEVASDLGLTYGGDSSVVNASNFAIGARRDGGFGYLPEGDIARLIFDNAALSQGDVTALHGSYLNEVPEPGSLALLGIGGLLLTRRRK